MNKTVYTVCVNNYFPELCELTFPWLKRYADRIGANFEVITERKFPEFPPTYEKLQIHDLGKDNDWNILIDADMLVGPNFHNVTFVNPWDHIGLYMTYDASLLFKADQYFARDGRRIGIASNFLCVNRGLHDIWTPLEYGFETAKDRTKRLHILDEFCISRNVARFGIKVSGLVMNEEPIQAPEILIPDKVLDRQLLHLDVTSNSKETVLDVARKWIKRQQI